MQVIEVEAIIIGLTVAGNQLVCIFTEIIKRSRNTVPNAFGRVRKALHIFETKLPRASQQLVLKTINANLVADGTANRIHMPRCFKATKYQCSRCNLREGNDVLLVSIQVNIAQRNITELRRIHLAKLFFDSPPALDTVFQKLAGFLLCHLLIGVDQLRHARESSSDSGIIPRIVIVIQREIIAE